MRRINLAIRQPASDVLQGLQKRGLIKTLAPSRRLLCSSHPNGAMETLYCASYRHGSHKLVCIKKNSGDIRFTFHPGNEEFIIMNTAARASRPLYIVIGLYARRALARKLKNGTLSARDFVCLEFSPRGKEAYIFTMLKDTVHCEIAGPGRGTGPVFFVSEPSRLKLHAFKTPGYTFFADGTVPSAE